MNSPGTGPLHVVRVVLLTAAVLGLTTGLHAAVGGATPHVVPFLALGVVTGAAVRRLARRELSLPRLIVVLGPVQVVLHLVLEGAGDPGGTASVTSHAVHGTAAAEAPAASSSLLMLAAHVVATLAVALVLRHGEAVLWRLWSWLTCRTLPGRPGAVVAGRAFPRPDLTIPRAQAAPWKVRGRAPPAAA